MAFCTNCGTEMSLDARFCMTCGKPAGGTELYPPIDAPREPLEYTIQGDNLQVARVKLKPGQRIYAEAGKMVYKTANISWETQMKGKSLGDKLIGALKRKLTGESLFLTYFQALSAPAEVGFAGDYPGRIQVFELPAGKSILAQRDSFVFAETTVEMSIALVKKIGAGLFGGEGFVLQKFTGPGAVFIHGGGDFIEFELRAGEVLQVDTGCVVCFEDTVNYDIQFVGNIKSAIFGGEGLFLTTLTGPGKVIVQSLTLEKLRRELGSARTGGDERGPLGSVTGLLSSED